MARLVGPMEGRPPSTGWPPPARRARGERRAGLGLAASLGGPVGWGAAPAVLGGRSLSGACTPRGCPAAAAPWTALLWSLSRAWMWGPRRHARRLGGEPWLTRKRCAPRAPQAAALPTATARADASLRASWRAPHPLYHRSTRRRCSPRSRDPLARHQGGSAAASHAAAPPGPTREPRDWPASRP